MDGAARGKVILTGEHAVVHGAPGIVAAIGRGARARAEPGPAEIELPQEQIRARPDDGSELGRAFAALLSHTGQRARRVTAWFDLPIRAGLGSSAALAVAVARALGADEPTCARAALAAEQIFHGGQASGIDTEAARRGGIGAFGRETGWRELTIAPLTLLVGLSGRTRETRTAIARVSELRQSAPETARYACGAIADLVPEIEQALGLGDLPRLGHLMNVNHEHLCALGVGTAELDELCARARAAGALGAKLTGGGLGGAVIALAPSTAPDVLAAWRAAGYDGFEARIPCGP